MQESDDRPLIFCRKVQRLNGAVEVWISITATIVVLDHILQHGEAAVMHVRRRARDLRDERLLDEGRFAVKPEDLERPRLLSAHRFARW